MNIPICQASTVEEAVENADVIVTATYATEPLVHFRMIKPNVHINGKNIYFYIYLMNKINNNMRYLL